MSKISLEYVSDMSMMTGRWQPDLCTFEYLCICVIVYLCIYVFVISFQSRNRKAKGEYSDDRQVAL